MTPRRFAVIMAVSVAVIIASVGVIAIFADTGSANSSPEVVRSSMSPTGDLQSRTVTLEARVEDPDFPTGDSVTVRIFKDSTEIFQTSISSNQTVSTTTTFVTGGDHSYRFEAADSSLAFDFEEQQVRVPSNLSIRNESNPDQKLSGVTAEVEFFADGSVTQRTTSDGDLNLTGLPTGETLVADVEAPGFRSRRILIRSLYQQQSIYMLNNSVSSSNINFVLDDATGSFSDPGTQFLVQRALNQSNNTEYRTVVGEEIGADKALPVTLETPERYRLVVRSTDGETRTLGGYQADGPEDPEVVPIGSLSFSGDTKGGVSVSASLETDTRGGFDHKVQAVYFDEQDATSKLNITFQRRDNGNVLHSVVVQDPSQLYVEKKGFNSQIKDNVTIDVFINATRSGEPDVNRSLIIGDTPDPAENFPLAGDVLKYGSWLLLFAAASWLALRAPRAAPIGTTVAATALTILGALSIPSVFLGLAGATSVSYLVAGGER